VLQEFDKDIDQQEALPTMGNPPQVAPEALATLKSSQSILDDNGTLKEAPALETTPVLQEDLLLLKTPQEASNLDDDCTLVASVDTEMTSNRGDAGVTEQRLY
jgi:hypothetical protein